MGSKTSGSTAKPGQPQPEAIVFSQATVLETVRFAPRLGRIVTSDEVNEVRKRGNEGADKLLAAAAIFGMTAPKTLKPREGSPPRGFSAYAAYTSNADKGQQNKNHFGYEEFRGLLAVVGVFGDELANTLREPTDRTLRLRKLYDDTDGIEVDGLPHPVLESLPPITGYSVQDSRRKDVMQADRLLRHILLRSIAPPAPSVPEA